MLQNKACATFLAKSFPTIPRTQPRDVQSKKSQRNFFGTSMKLSRHKYDSFLFIDFFFLLVIQASMILQVFLFDLCSSAVKKFFNSLLSSIKSQSFYIASLPISIGLPVCQLTSTESDYLIHLCLYRWTTMFLLYSLAAFNLQERTDNTFGSCV